MKQLILLNFVFFTLVHAETFNVSNNQEFRNALENAAINGQNDEIVLSAGIYKTTTDNQGTFTFVDTEDYDLTIKSNDNLTHGDVILDGNNQDRVLEIDSSSNSSFVFENITIRNGLSPLLGAGLHTGRLSQLTITDCNISNNIGSGFYSFGKLTLINSIISYNTGRGFYMDNYSSPYFGIKYDTKIIDTVIANNTSNLDGGGFSSVRSVEIQDSTIYNNSSSERGGGFFTFNGSIAKIINSQITNNTSAKEGGGFYSDGITLIDTVIANNTSNLDGGGFYDAPKLYAGNSSYITMIVNSKIDNNTASNGGAFYSDTNVEKLLMLNSIVSNNDSLENNSYDIEAIRRSIIINNIFHNNKKTFNAYGVFINNIFNENEIDIILKNDSTFLNNYIDYSKIEINNKSIIKKNNIQPIYEGELYFNDDNITLASNSPAIDVGLIPTNDAFINLFTSSEYNTILAYFDNDILGNNRIYNEVIDLGAAEYGISNLNTEIKLSTNGDEKIYSTISVDINISLVDDTHIQELYINYGDNIYEIVLNTITSFEVSFTSAGSKTIGVKVVDSKNVITEKSLDLSVKDLTIQEAISFGKQICIDKPSDCGLEDLESAAITTENINDLLSGWHLMGSSYAITDTSIFDSASIIWRYSSGSWEAYSPKAEINTEINAKNIKSLNSIESNQGFWVKKP